MFEKREIESFEIQDRIWFKSQVNLWAHLNVAVQIKDQAYKIRSKVDQTKNQVYSQAREDLR